MKINSMKFSIILIELLMISAIMAGLFFLEIPEGNQKVSYVIMGSLITDTMHSINNMFNKREKVE